MRFERFQIRKTIRKGVVDVILSNHRTRNRARLIFQRAVKHNPTAFIFDADRGVRIPTGLRALGKTVRG